jgi:hypothetical protein
MSDKEYLARPELDVKFKYNKVYIDVSSEHTCYLRFEKMIKLNQKDILDSYSAVIKQCREMGIKISYKNKYKQFVLDNWQAYLDAYKKYSDIFDNLLSMIPKLEDRGIHQGTSDDVYLNEVINYSYKLNDFYFRNSILYQMRGIYYELGTLENNLRYERTLKDPMSHITGKTVKVCL